MDYKIFKIYDQEVREILKELRIATCMNEQDFDLQFEESGENTIPYNLKELAVSDVLCCSYCNVSFADGLEQRNHYKLDWHRYNLKRALSGNESVPENIFDLLSGDISSISGSDSERFSEDTDIDIEDENVGESLKLPSENFRCKFKTIRHTKVFFENHENKILSIYRCLLHNKRETVVQDELVKNAFSLINKQKIWLVVMLGGGHFAAAIFEDGSVLNHKTFHCYTVRAKQGGSQLSKDKSNNHPKSAGASLRRYNEHALVQHVQEIMAAWSNSIQKCSLILYRAAGPYNRSILFGGKNPVLIKTDSRLRNIPFPTKRATFKEVKRVYEKLSCVEIYGSSEAFKDKFPQSPNKGNRPTKIKTKLQLDHKRGKKNEFTEEIKSPQKNRSKTRTSPQRKIFEQNIPSSSNSSSEEENNYELVYSNITVSFQNLHEYEGTVFEYIKDFKNNNEQKKKRKKLRKKQKVKLEEQKWVEKFGNMQKNLVESCENGNCELLLESLKIYDTLPEAPNKEQEDKKMFTNLFTKKDFIDCLNAPINQENKNTLLHLSALKGLPEFITLLMVAGADPSIKNKNKLTPYVIARDKQTRNSFTIFAASHPNKYDFKKANIPEPLTEEQKKKFEEKKKEKKKLKRTKEKIKRQEDREKRIEEEEKKKFLALSDREKCALAAEHRLIAQSTAHLKSAKPVLCRCFQCGLDITGKVPFEYGINRFCTIPCVKAHRLKTNSYGMEI